MDKSIIIFSNTVVAGSYATMTDQLPKAEKRNMVALWHLAGFSIRVATTMAAGDAIEVFLIDGNEYVNTRSSGMLAHYRRDCLSAVGFQETSYVNLPFDVPIHGNHITCHVTCTGHNLVFQVLAYFSKRWVDRIEKYVGDENEP